MSGSKYDTEFCKIMIKLAAEGRTPAQIAQAIGITKPTLLEWANEKTSKHPDFVDAYKRARTAFQSYHEDLMVKGLKGVLPKYSSATHMFFMKNNFKDDYSETTTQKIELKNDLKGLSNQEIDDAIRSLLVQRKLNNEKQ